MIFSPTQTLSSLNILHLLKAPTRARALSVLQVTTLSLTLTLSQLALPVTLSAQTTPAPTPVSAASLEYDPSLMAKYLQLGFAEPLTEVRDGKTYVVDSQKYGQAIENNLSRFNTLRDYAATYGPKAKADPILITWWALTQTDQSFNPYTYSKCGPDNKYLKPDEFCIINGQDSDIWQVGYGHPFASATTNLVAAYQAAYGDPNNKTKVQSTLQSLMAKNSITGTAPSLTVQEIQDKAGPDQPNRRWAYYLSKDPAISAYLLGLELADFHYDNLINTKDKAYFTNNRKVLSNALYQVLTHWGTPKTPNSNDLSTGNGTLGGPTEPPVDLEVPDCPGVVRTINAYNLPPSIYPKPNCGAGTPAGNNLGQPSGKYGTGTDAPPAGTLFWVITGGVVHELSQGYGMNDFAAQHIGPNGMYSYCNGYGTPGHCGVDVSADIGTQIYSPVNGTVVCDGTSDTRQGDPDEPCSAFSSSSPHAPHKGRLEIKLDNGDYLIFGHMNTISVRIGDKVLVSQPIGTVGQMVDEGGHLHLEYRRPDASQVNGKTTLDPRDMLDVPYSGNLPSTNSPQVAVPTTNTLAQSNSGAVLAETTIATTYAQFKQKYGFQEPNGPSHVDWDLYRDVFTTVRDNAVKVAPSFNIEPEMIVWWVFFETKPPYDSYTYSNCLDNASKSVVSYVCEGATSGGWQVGYGQQYSQTLDLIAEAFEKTHGNPNDTALVAKVIQEIMQKSGLSDAFPGNLTVAQMIANEPTYRKWIFALQRDPGISLYALARELSNDTSNATNGRTFADVMAGWSSYYSSAETKQTYSNILNDVLLNWGIAGSSLGAGVCQIGVAKTSGGCSSVPDQLGMDLEDFVAGINRNIAAYKEIAQCADVPWQMMAAVHWRETQLDENYDGAGTGGAKGPWQIDPTGAVWGSVDPHNFTEAGCAVAKKEFQAKSESGPFKQKLNQDMDPTNLEQSYRIKDAFFAYNGKGGFEQNIGKGCTPALDNNPQLNFDCSAYVMCNWDDNHLDMSIMFQGKPFPDCRDGTWKVFYKLYFSTYGPDGKLLVYGGNCTLANEVIDGFSAPTKANTPISMNFWEPYPEPYTSLGMHKGIDIAGKNGDPVFALANGTIIASGYSTSGYHIIIKVDKDTNGSKNDYWLYYGHLSADDLLAKDTPVVAGQQIGKIGKTVEMVNGQAKPNGTTNGEHLHFSIWTSPAEGSNPNDFINPCSIKVIKNSYSNLDCQNYGSLGKKWTD